MNHHFTDESDAADELAPRQEAARRLATVGMLQMHQLRRAMRPGGGAPWRDPSQGQGRVLALLKLQPEITQKELTYLLGMSRQAVAELLGKLERQGLVEREPSAEDKRVAVVRLTEAGREAEQAQEEAGRPSHELLDVLEDDDVEALSGYLGKILDRAGQEYEREADATWQSRGFGPEWRRGRGGFGRGEFPGFPGGPGGFPGFLGGPGGFPGFPGGPRGPHGRPGGHDRRRPGDDETED